MLYTSMVALVLWEHDFNDLESLLAEQKLKPAKEIFGKIGRFKTPDETYVCMYSDWMKWDPDNIPEIGVIKDMMRSLRHSFIRIGDEVGDVEVDCESEDYRGVDEEFDLGNLIDVNTSLVGLECFVGLEEFGISELGNKITSGQIRQAEKCLVDNGIEPDEASTVLQALGYILLDKELYPDKEVKS